MRPKAISPLTNIGWDPRHAAWHVTIRRQGQDVFGHFAAAVWGGSDQALVAAQRFRDEALLELEPDMRVRRGPARGKRSSTGVVGVGQEMGRDGPRSFVAHWTDPDAGKQRRRFLISRHGFARAFELAVAARTEGVERAHAVRLARQRAEARQRLAQAPPAPRQVKSPLDRKGTKRRRDRRRK